MVGSSLLISSKALIPFVNTNTVKTGISLVSIPAGVWSISFGWSFSASSSTGNGSNNNVLYGLSYTSTGYEIVSLNARYSITHLDLTTYESYSEASKRAYKQTDNCYRCSDDKLFYQSDITE